MINFNTYRAFKSSSFHLTIFVVACMMNDRIRIVQAILSNIHSNSASSMDPCPYFIRQV